MKTRDVRLDSLRGILLVIMTFNHLNGGISLLTAEPFGFVSAAEGFVLLSAYTMAITWKKDCVPLGLMFSIGLRRAWRIYKYHAALLLILACVALVSPIYAGYWSSRFFTADNSLGHTVVAGLFLAHQPTYFDILPMYVIFSLLTPFLLRVLQDSRGGAVLLLSAAVWLAGQSIHLVPDLSGAGGWETKAGLFNLLSWQALWVVGLTLGFVHAHLGHNPAPLQRRVVLAAAFVVLLCFMIRHELIALPPQWLEHFNKTHLSALRVLNIGAQLVLALYILASLHRDRGLPWFGFIGRYSLQVFTYHVFIVYALLPFGWRIEAMGVVTEAVFHVLIVSTLTLPAWSYRRWRERKSDLSKLPSPALPG